MSDPTLDPKFIAGVDMLRRTGMRQVQIRYHDDEEPTVWMVVAIYPTAAETAAALDPVTAMLRLCAQVVDGGCCVHCARPTAFDVDTDDTINEMLSQGTVCWTMWDPELATFRRGCE